MRLIDTIKTFIRSITCKHIGCIQPFIECETCKNGSNYLGKVGSDTE